MPWSMNRPGPIRAPGWISMPVTGRQAQVALVERVRGAVHPERVEARVAEQHLGERAGRGVALARDLDVAGEGPRRVSERGEPRAPGHAG
jgi:hypothetical protein